MKHNRWRFFFGEAIRSLRTNVATTLAATVTVLIVMFLAGVGIALGSYIYSYTEKVKSDLSIKVFVDDNATHSQQVAIGQKLRADVRVDQATINFIDKDEAFLRARKLFGKDAKLLKFVPRGTFPRSWEAKARDAGDLSAIAASFKGVAGLDADKTQENPQYGGKTSDRVLKVAGAVEGVIALMSLILLAAAILLIGNTIRLSIFARRREVEVMKLVGATNWFVRWPFVLEGVICGLLGSALAVLLLIFSGEALKNAWGDSVFNGASVSSIGMPTLAAILLLAGLALGAAGSGLTMRRFLRV